MNEVGEHILCIARGLSGFLGKWKEEWWQVMAGNEPQGMGVVMREWEERNYGRHEQLHLKKGVRKEMDECVALQCAFNIIL